jgi:hypothetical protein
MFVGNFSGNIRIGVDHSNEFTIGAGTVFICVPPTEMAGTDNRYFE